MISEMRSVMGTVVAEISRLFLMAVLKLRLEKSFFKVLKARELYALEAGNHVPL